MLDFEDPGVAGMAYSPVLGPPSRLRHVDGSFADADGWDRFGSSSRAVGALLGLPESGPVVVMQRTMAWATSTPAATFPTETFRLVVAGSHQMGGRTYRMGDMRVQPAGEPWPQSVAGPEGLDEVLVLGDRRGARAETHGEAGERWSSALAELIERLLPLVPSAR